MALRHRLVDRGILSHISIMNFQFRAVWGSRGCREKKIKTAKSMLLLRAILICFQGQKEILIIVASALKGDKIIREVSYFGSKYITYGISNSTVIA